MIYLTEEIWKDIRGLENKYQVSNLGRIKSLKRKGCKNDRILINREDGRGYYQVSLFDGNGNSIKRKVHRIVADAFVAGKFEKAVVNHINEVKTDNNARNLEWITQKENVRHGTGIARSAFSRGKSVAQFGIDGVLKRIYPSVIEAEALSGINKSNIYDCVHNRVKTAGGYIWKYT